VHKSRNGKKRGKEGKPRKLTSKKHWGGVWGGAGPVLKGGEPSMERTTLVEDKKTMSGVVKGKTAVRGKRS